MKLDLSHDIVTGIIDRIRAFNEQDSVTPLEDESEPDISDESLAGQMIDRYGSDPIYQQLKATIEDLEPDQQISLVALTWVGRGDYDMEEWDDAIEHAQESWNDHTADYLIGTPLLADYLTEALDLIDEDDEQ